MTEHEQDHRISATALRYGSQYFPDGLATLLFLSSISRANLIEYEESFDELRNNLFDFEQCADHLIKRSSTIEQRQTNPLSRLTVHTAGGVASTRVTVNTASDWRPPPSP